MRFIVHVSVWDMVNLALLGVFVVSYLVVWAATSWQEHRRTKK